MPTGQLFLDYVYLTEWRLPRNHLVNLAGPGARDNQHPNDTTYEIASGGEQISSGQS